MDITIKITDQDTVVYEKTITLTEKFQATLPSTFVMETIFSGAVESAQEYMKSKFSTDALNQYPIQG